MLGSFNGIEISPEVHGIVNYDFKGKAPRINATFDGLAAPLPSKTSKPTRTFFNVGTSVTTNYQMMEYGVGYDATIGNKFVGHTGTMKVRINL